MKILSVDDHSENLYLIEMLGRSQGHKVVSVHNGVEAIDQLRMGPFDLIVSDILMPAMDGFQLCRTLKLDERWKRIPFVFYTATYTSREDQDLALSLGASRFIVKPVEPEEFLEAIEQVVREGESKQLPAPASDVGSGEILGLYNQALVRKLERKIDQLESARAELLELLELKNREAAARHAAEEALRRSEENFVKAFLSNPAAIAINDLVVHRYIEVNGAFEKLTGYSRDDVIGKTWDDIGLWVDTSSRDDAFRLLLEQGSLDNWEFKFRKKDGKTGTGLFSAALIEFDGRACAITAKMDITERLELEKQLQHAQKLESIGRLAGGVAHDFNNLLTVISGYNDMTLSALDSSSPLHVNAVEIRRAGERAASLTQQLLAFSRKQVISIKPVNINTVVIDAERMLQRVIGEDIQLVTKLDPDLGQVRTDADQIHQVIMNLAVNARDAMPQGGTIVIETANLNVEERTGADRPERVAGPYVMMTVSDTGVGMNEEVLGEIFEPFYTTKERGKGTGLGLSTVYGIVRQSNGWIEVSSKVGQGTSFRIFLPRMENCVQDEAVRAGVAPALSPGSGTILLVEDEVAVRRLTERMLKDSGLKVISAGSGIDAVQVAAGCPDEIDLLLTDVIMPGVSGKELFERLRKTRPKLSVIFMSGYTDDVIVSRGVLDPSVAYIAKPFSRDVLVAKVREVLSKVIGADSSAGES